MTFAGRGSDLRPKDFLTHADGIRVLSGRIAASRSRYQRLTVAPGGLQAFLDSGEREVIVPIVDDSEVKFGKWSEFILSLDKNLNQGDRSS